LNAIGYIFIDGIGKRIKYRGVNANPNVGEEEVCPKTGCKD